MDAAMTPRSPRPREGRYLALRKSLLRLRDGNRRLSEKWGLSFYATAAQVYSGVLHEMKKLDRQHRTRTRKGRGK